MPWRAGEPSSASVLKVAFTSIAAHVDRKTPTRTRRPRRSATSFSTTAINRVAAARTGRR
jgi:hypothetical protein